MDGGRELLSRFQEGVLGTGYWVLGIGFWILGTGLVVPTTQWVLVTQPGGLLQVTGRGGTVVCEGRSVGLAGSLSLCLP